jgi:hypothetical protein
MAATAIRVLAFAIPLIAAWLVVRFTGAAYYRPAGWHGMVLWVAQAIVVGTATTITVDRWSRRLLPLAALFGMSLVFPDAAPSRFGMALRLGSVKRLEERALAADASAQEAAEHALILVSGLSAHDRMTRGHSERVRAHSDLIGEELGLDDLDRARLSWAALLHDIGKIDVPAEILNKDGRPSDEEWATLAEHPSHAASHLGALVPWLGPWIGAATEHHERWDGLGYPLGTAGTDISLAGRIVAVADAYDTMTSRRSYKPPIAPEAAKRELVDSAGTQFDPEVVRAFLNVSLGHRWMGGFLTWLAEVPAVSSAASTGLGAAAPAAFASAALVVGSLAPGFFPAAAPTLALADGSSAAVITQPTTSTTVPPTTTTVASTTTTTVASTTTTTVAPEDLDFAIDDEYELETGKKKNLKVFENDGDTDFIDTIDEDTLEIISGPSHANMNEFRVHNDHVHYESIDGFVGTDEFRYRVCTFDGVCGIATVTIRVIDD